MGDFLCNFIHVFDAVMDLLCTHPMCLQSSPSIWLKIDSKSTDLNCCATEDLGFLMAVLKILIPDSYVEDIDS